MQDVIIHCPHCHHEIRLDETLAGPLVAETRKTFETQIAAMAAAITERESAANRMMIDAETLRAEAEEELARRVTAERTRIAAEEAQKAQAAAQTELEGLRQRSAEQNAKLAEAQKAQKIGRAHV